MSLTVFVCTPTWQIATVDRALVTWVKTENWIHSYLKKIEHYRPRDHGAPEYRLLVIIIKHKDPKGHPVFMLLFYHFYPPPSKSVVEHIILQALPGYFLLRSCWNYDLVKRRQFFLPVKGFYSSGIFTQLQRVCKEQLLSSNSAVIHIIIVAHI